jgi:S-DNA-T family DNA segregation ATPase FtsK/SpoIIIE
VRIRALPERVHLTTLRAPRGSFVVGLGGDDVECLTFAPFGGSRRFLVAGPPRSGRSTTLQSLAQQAVKTGVNTVVAALPRSGLATTARQLSLPLVTPASSPPATPPDAPTVLLVDDSEGFLDGPAGERLAAWLREDWAPLCAVVAGRSDELATSYRGLGAEVRRSRCGLLLRPGPVDGELLGVRLPRRPSTGPPGRGVVVGDPDWSPLFASGEPVPVQVATP